MAQAAILSEEEIVKLFDTCSNWGRWGEDDELGTLNYITPRKRLEAARLVQTGEAFSLEIPLSTRQWENNPRPVQHIMVYEQHRPISALDYIGVFPHGFAVTHLDAITHVYWEDKVYNGRNAAEVCTNTGLTFGSIFSQRDGIFTRGVLLDVAGARGVDWLPPTETIMPEALEAAEQFGKVRVESGDALFVRVGLGAHEAAEGPENLAERAGFGPEAVQWLHEREVAVYSGDCVDKIPYPNTRVPLPLYMIGLVAMGLVMLDITDMERLSEACRRNGRYEFLLSVAPLALPRGTGSPVNPIVVF
jgi:kynurenine formamidase